jgi:hypothetical protein
MRGKAALGFAPDGSARVPVRHAPAATWRRGNRSPGDARFRPDRSLSTCSPDEWSSSQATASCVRGQTPASVERSSQHVRAPRARRLLRFVRLGSERVRQAVRHDSSFAKKQASPLALLDVVHSGRLALDRPDARNHAERGSHQPTARPGLEPGTVRRSDVPSTRSARRRAAPARGGLSSRGPP